MCNCKQCLMVRAKELIEGMTSLKEEERIEILDLIHSAFCRHCGGEGGSGCMCTRDE